jgi:hypothetical protein
MTPQEAAAKCRREAARCKVQGDYRALEAYKQVELWIDQINQPQPWPPPEEMQKYGVFVLAWMPTYGAWGLISWSHRGWTDDNYYLPEVSHYLPLPPAPEVQP